MSLIKKVQKNIKKYQLLSSKETLILAVSGGMDSVSLLDIVYKIRKGNKIIVAHLNHSLRGRDSGLDQEFVRKLAEKYKLEFETKKVNVKKTAKKEKCNLEETARKERYKFLAQVVKKYKTTKILTAHHADDQVETVILNYLRGADYQGLSGMNFKNKNANNIFIVRPFLNIWRKDILKYQQKNNLSFRQDKSNSDIKIKRNYLRLKSIPELEKKDRNFKGRIWQESQRLKQKITYLEPKIRNIYQKIKEQEFHNAVILYACEFNQLDKVLKAEILKKALSAISDLKNISKKNILDVLKATKATKTGKTVILPNQLRVIIDYDNVILLKGAFSNLEIEKRKLKLGQNIISGSNLILRIGTGGKITKKFFSYDFDKINFPLYTRSVKPGDSFKPEGFRGTKKLQDLFVDLKIPQRLRKLIPVVVDRNDKIMGVLGIRQGQSSFVDKKTKKILKIGLERLKQ